ncbi:glycine-rich cell wall structural protein 1.0-like, partial [Miscanthus floridulus]|uniref:glycine-rich cell wall structural protein 1.0-like n=1 Tax=Miscanthus floridulus TaxID=154761 RepID=UPI00345B3E9C
MARRFSSSSGLADRRAWAGGAAGAGHLRRVEASGGVGLLRWPAPPPSSSDGRGPGVRAGAGRAGLRGGGRGAAGRAAAGRERGGRAGWRWWPGTGRRGAARWWAAGARGSQARCGGPGGRRGAGQRRGKAAAASTVLWAGWALADFT